MVRGGKTQTGFSSCDTLIMSEQGGIRGWRWKITSMCYPKQPGSLSAQFPFAMSLLQRLWLQFIAGGRMQSACSSSSVGSAGDDTPLVTVMLPEILGDRVHHPSFGSGARSVLLCVGRAFIQPAQGVGNHPGIPTRCQTAASLECMSSAWDAHW